jgi:hypothetical protein
MFYLLIGSILPALQISNFSFAKHFLWEFIMKYSVGFDFLVGEEVALTHVKQQQCIWLELSNEFDCMSQKENIFLNTENKRIIGVLTGFVGRAFISFSQ